MDLAKDVSNKGWTPVEVGASWTEVLQFGNIPEPVITHIMAHLSAVGPADIVYTSYHGSIGDEISGGDIVERLVAVGRDGVGLHLQHRSFSDEPEDLIESFDAIYLCRAVRTDYVDIPYIYVDVRLGDPSSRATIICRRTDFIQLCAALRETRKGAVLRQGAQVVDSGEIDDTSEEDYVFQDNLLVTVLDQTVRFLTGPTAEKLRKWGLPPKRGVILYGPPGNGKTVLTRLCAKHALIAGLNVVIIQGKRRSAWSFDESIMGLGDELRQAAAHGPALLIFEDIDLHCPGRPKELDTSREVNVSQLAEMLEFLDGVIETDGYVLLVTTNYIDRLDPALTRSGRLTERIHVGGPELRARIDLLKRLLRNGPTPIPDVSAAAQVLNGCSFADLAEVSRRFKMAAAYDEYAKLDELLGHAARELALERNLAPTLKNGQGPAGR